MKKVILGIVVVVLGLAVLAGAKFMQIRKLIASSSHGQLPPETIASAIVAEEKWESTLSAIGSVAAVQGVNVSAELAGKIVALGFESGAVVAKDDLLVKLDTSLEEAQLRAAEAQVEWARISAERARKLRAESTLSQSELDAAEAGLKQNEASADAIRATIAKKTIRAPFAGRLGIRLVNLGEFLDVGKPIVSLQSLATVYVDFSLPQQELAQLKTGMKVRVSTDTYPGKQFDGQLTAINPDLDSATRSVRLRATLENPENQLRPGMFARAEIILPEQQNVVVVPATSVLNAPFGNSVYVIESRPAGTNGPAGLVVRQKIVRTGRMRGDFIAVETGVKPGEKGVSTGLFKLRNGMSVVENNELTPKPSATPKPADS